MMPPLPPMYSMVQMSAGPEASKICFMRALSDVQEAEVSFSPSFKSMSLIIYVD